MELVFKKKEEVGKIILEERGFVCRFYFNGILVMDLKIFIKVVRFEENIIAGGLGLD